MSEVKTNKISSVSTNGDITLDPDGTGDTIIASGNLGVGTTSPDHTLTVSASSSPVIEIEQISGGPYKTNIVLNGNDTEFRGSSGNIEFYTGNNDGASSTERMRIDSNGTVTFTEGDAITVIDRVGTNVAGIKTGSGDDFCVGTDAYTQAIRIKNSTGHVGIGTTDPSNGHLSVKTEQNENAVFVHNNASSMTSTSLQVSTSRNTTNSTYEHFACSIHGVATKMLVRDSGNLQNSNNSYGSLSDQRMKENIVDAASQWDDIKALQVRKYNRIGETQKELGVIAQELEASGMGGLVEEGAWYDVANNPNEETRKSVKYSILYMKAVKALQEAMTRIETLETQNTTQATQIADLITRVTALEDA